MTNHIPGPYCVDRDGDISLDYGERWTLAFMITNADCQPEDSSGPPFTPEQLAATKALLASAPDMHAEIVRLREQVRVLREAAQWVVDACNEAGNDAQVCLIIAAERCEDAIGAAKAMEPTP